MVRRYFFTVFVIAAALSARAEPEVRLLQPAQGATLTGASTAVLQWSADGIDDRAGIEEWEAFLSLDGGRYYGVRITPHLDLSIREFRWEVPNVDAADARILIRFGDERKETAFELPGGIRITAGPHRAVTPLRADAPGEPARPGDPGVAVWTDGDRHGNHVSSVAVSIAFLDRHRTVANGARATAALVREASFIAGSCTVEIIRPRRLRPHPRSDDSSPPDVLLQSSRLNI